MPLRVLIEPRRGASYDDLLAVAQRTGETGFDAFSRSDHCLAMGGDRLLGPTDAWGTLAGLARDTSRIRVGTLMSAATFRLPGPLALSVAQHEAEHTAYGVPFLPLGERFDRYEEQLEIVTGLWSTPVGADVRPRGPAPPARRVLGAARARAARRRAGDRGRARRTSVLAAWHAAESTVPFSSVGPRRWRRLG